MAFLEYLTLPDSIQLQRFWSNDIQLFITLSKNVVFVEGFECKSDAVSFFIPPVIHQLPSEKVKLAAVIIKGEKIAFLQKESSSREMLANFPQNLTSWIRIWLSWIYGMFLEWWNTTKILSTIWQSFSCLLDEGIA